MKAKKILYLLPVFVVLITACSTKKNTAATRFYHSFTARYNIYYNGNQAFIEAQKQQEKNNKDDFTELLPVFPISNKSTQGVGKSQYETAIEKSQKAIQLHSIQKKPQVSASDRQKPKVKKYLQREEYNPFLYKAWLMMAKSQYYKGEFIEAASTFSYITRHYAAEPLICGEARAWLARCYSQIGWFYDAEDALTRMTRDTMNKKVRLERDASMAELLIRQERYKEALPYLQTTAKTAKGSLQKARLYYLLGQIDRQLGNREAAYKDFGKVISKNPTFELEFNARIQQTEVLSEKSGQQKRMISRLRRMARNDKYKDCLDQVYFAIGNIYLSRQDTANAVTSYETGRTKATKSGVEKGALLLQLADIYWQQRKFNDAQRCYTEAIGMINKERKDYAEITRRSRVLDKLVPFTDAIHLQDSLQELSLMNEEDRNAAIDRMIALEKHRQEEARKASRDSAAQARMRDNAMEGNADAQIDQPKARQNSNDNAEWYFYNPVAVSQGKQNFIKQWGKRENQDDWRRSNRTVINMPDKENLDDLDEETRDSIMAAQAEADSIAQAEAEALEDPANDPLKREYYLKDIPFTAEQKEASNLIIMDGLHHAGVIIKDDLEDFPLAVDMLNRICKQYPDYSQMQDVYYQLFLLYMRWKKPEMAEQYRNLLSQYYPESDTTRTITHPNFLYNAKYGRQIEDSLYAATYDAFRQKDFATVDANTQISTEEFPSGLNRPKFLFVHALSRMGRDDSKKIAADLRELVSRYPDSDVSKMAGMIVKGLEAGRKIGDSSYDPGSLWSRRTLDASEVGDSTKAEGKLTAERNAPFVFLIAYPNDSLDDNQLLYDLARYNFTAYTVRQFDINKVSVGGLTQFRISGFANYDEAHMYAQKIFKNESLAEKLRHTHTFLISDKNLKLVGVNYSFDDYTEYFEKFYAPMKLNTELPLDDEPEIKQYYEDELTPEQLEQYQNKSNGESEETGDDDGGEWY